MSYFMGQLGLITLYGIKPLHFERFISSCQEILSDVLENTFTPYTVEQIHGTIISLARASEDTLLNLEFYKANEKTLTMDILGFLREIKSHDFFPIKIRIGGFKGNDIPFLSKGQSPYRRSFSIQGEKAIVIGWPVSRNSTSDKMTYSDVLGVIRNLGEKYNIKHMYNQSDFIDNEYYFRIGLAKDTTSAQKIHLAEKVLRDYISEINPLTLELGISDIFIAGYQDETLPISSTKVLPITSVRTMDDIFGLLNIPS
jgi:hypothetical protein